MKTLEQLLTIGSCAGLGLLLSCTADNKNEPTDSDTEYVSDDSGNDTDDSGKYDTGDSGTYDTGDSGSESCVPWEQTFGESVNDILSVKQTIDDGYVMAGITRSSGNYDGWLIKTDGNGNKQWEQTFGGSETDSIYSVQQTTDGGYVLAGYTRSSGAGSSDGWLIKTDADGNKQWEQTFGGNDDDEFSSVQQTTDGGYVLAGQTYSSGAGNADGWLIKTDVSGNKQWEQTFGGNDDDGFSSVQQTTDSSYVLAGYTESSGAGNYDGWLIKTDADGNKQLEQTFGGNDDDEFSSVQQTTDGGYVMAGYTRSSGAGGSDGWLLKTDGNGSMQLEQTFGGSGDDNFPSMQQTTDGGYVMAGYTNSSEEGSEGWLVKTDVNGNKQWEQTFGENEDGIFWSVQQTTDGGYVLAGRMNSGSDGWLVKACDL